MAKINAGSQKRTNKIKALGELTHSGPRAFRETIPIPRESADGLTSSYSCTLMLGLESTGRHWVQSRKNDSLGKSGFCSVTKGTQQPVGRKINKHRYPTHQKLPYIQFISYEWERNIVGWLYKQGKLSHPMYRDNRVVHTILFWLGLEMLTLNAFSILLLYA